MSPNFRLLPVAALLWTSSILFADTVLLKTGGRIEGEILNPTREKGDAVQVRSAAGVKLALTPAQVVRIIAKTDLQKQYETDAAKLPNTIEDHAKLAEWCRESGLMEERKIHLEAILKLDPDHAAARAALGFGRVGDRWMKPDEFMRKQGYVQHAGKWVIKQEKELSENHRRWELDTKDWRRKLKLWLGNIGGKREGDAIANIRAIKDEAAGPPLAEILASGGEDPEIRLMCLDVLNRMPENYSTPTLIQIGFGDPDVNIRDRCLDELKRRQSEDALHAYIRALKPKSEDIKYRASIQQAAYCLERLGNAAAILPLMDALVTRHKYTIMPGGQPPGQIGASFNGAGGFPSGPQGSGGSGGSGGAGSGGFGPGGGFSMGGKPEVVTRDFENPAVRSALQSLCGTSFGFDPHEWKAWYISTHTSPDLNLRRAP